MSGLVISLVVDTVTVVSDFTAGLRSGVVDGCSLLSDLCEASFGFSPVTVVLAPPEACTTLDGGSSVDSVVDEPADASEESDDSVVWSAGSDVEAVESVCEAVPVSAT